MYFDLSAFIHYNFRAFFKTRGKQYRLTPKRFLVLVIWLTLFIPAQIINRIFFLLDEVLFPKYRQQPVRQPIFIIGNPRSGTTFLHRLMFKDTDTFTAFTVWELILAPSITQRKLIWFLLAIGRLLGIPVRTLVKSINRLFKRGQRNSAHAINLNAAEEDTHILIHSWTSESLWAIYPDPVALMSYFFFDRDIPLTKQHKIMKFYKSMIQRHLYAHGGDRILLSKNPSHTSKIAALTETFRDARFINLARSPIEAMPSMLDYMSSGWKIFCDPLEPYPFKDEFFQVMRYFYLYPIEYFNGRDGRCKFLKYEHLVHHPDKVVEDLYDWLHLDYSNQYREIVARETEAARSYKSQHKYSIEKVGLTEQRVLQEFSEVFNHYEFESLQRDLHENEMYWRLNNWPREWTAHRKQRKHERKMQRLEKRALRKGRKIKPVLLKRLVFRRKKSH
jgi:hypothetical protein